MAKYHLSALTRKNHEKFSQGFEGMIPYITRSGGYYTGLTSEDVKRLAKKTGLSEEALQPPIEGNIAVGSYWRSFAMRVKKDGLNIDTDNPFGEIQYLFAKGHYQVADGKKRISQAKRFLLTNVDEEAIQSNAKAKVRRRALVAFDRMKHKEMRDALRVMGGKPSFMSDTLVEDSLNKIIEKEPQKFLDYWVDNEDAQVFVMIEEAIEANILRRVRNVYFYNNDTIGNSRDEAVKWWKNTKNEETVATIKGLTEKKMKL